MFYQIASKLTECVEQIEEQYGSYHRDLSNADFIQTGFSGLDNEIKGIPYGYITVIASEKLHGKTSLALGIALHAALLKGVTTVIIDSQRKSCRVTMRLIAQLSKIPIQTLMSGGLHDDEWGGLTSALGKLNDASISIKDDEPVSIEKLISELEATHRRSSIGLIVIDGFYFEETNQAEIQSKHKDSMTKLYRFAADFNIAVIVTAQLNQALRHGRNRIPSRRDVPFDIADMAEIVLIPYCPVQSLPGKEKSEVSGIAVYKPGSRPVFVPIKLNTDIGLFSEENGSVDTKKRRSVRQVNSKKDQSNQKILPIK